MTYNDILEACGLNTKDLEKGSRPVYTPIDGSLLGHVNDHTESDVKTAIANAQKAFKEWRSVPAPVRGGFVRLLGEELRAAK